MARSPEPITTDRAIYEESWLWIPGSPLTRRPGMTSSEIHLVAALEREDLARVVRRRDLQSESLENLAHPGHLLRVRFRKLARPDPQRVLHADAHVATHRGGLRGDAHLVGARAEH